MTHITPVHQIVAMPILKNKPLPLEHSYGSHSIETVRDWRNAVEEFFNEDWPKLTDLIQSIEESLWEDDLQDCVVSGLKEIDQSEVRNDERQSRGHDSGNHETRPESVSVSAEPEQQRRLEELAKKIEERLKKTSVQ